MLFVYVPIFTVACLVVGLIFDEHKGFSRLVDLVLTVGLNIFAFAWCRLDATERDYKLHRFSSYVVVLFGTLALLYYLFRVKGISRRVGFHGWLVLYAILSLGGSMIVAAILVLLAVLIGVVPVEIFKD